MKKSYYTSKTTWSQWNQKRSSGPSSSTGFRKLLKSRNNHQIITPVYQAEDSKTIAPNQRPPSAQSRYSTQSWVRESIHREEETQRCITDCDTQRSRLTSRMSATSRRKGTKLDELDQKLQRILQDKLCNWKQKSSNETLAKEFMALIEEVKVLKSEMEEDINLQKINKKIQLLEKIIAEHQVQSQILKESFYNCRNIRKSLVVSHQTYQASSNAFYPKNMPLETYKKKPSINFQTTSQETYQRHHKKYYQNNTQQNKKHHPNRQPVPRSSYAKEYLNYGRLPTYPQKQCETLANPIKGGKAETCYKADFKGKKVKKINQKELDCKCDKIRTIEMRFYPQKLNELKKHFRMQAQLKKGKENTHQMKKMMGKTEFSREFLGKGLAVENPIKNKKLNQYKFGYLSKVKC